MQDQAGRTSIMLFHTKAMVDVDWVYVDDQGYRIETIWLGDEDFTDFFGKNVIDYIHKQLAMIHG